jgi:CsoR family transcriptional regulator, copper-sensing transcriptional repressor|tara:strand:+ start:896 stop:1156 length:261 start_codon:yes stop_codon:yes gene_type:complete
VKHNNHKDQITSLKRIEGQVRGVQSMINEGKYCIDILNQIKAVKNAVITVEGSILKSHLKACLKESLNEKESFDGKVEEIMKLLKR